MYVLLEYVSLPRSSDVPECPRVACINSTYSIVGNETANLHSLGLGKITGLGSCFSKGVRVLPAPCTSDVVLHGSMPRGTVLSFLHIYGMKGWCGLV